MMQCYDGLDDDTPPLKGGQGRDAEDVDTTGAVLVRLFMLAWGGLALYLFWALTWGRHQ